MRSAARRAFTHLSMLLVALGAVASFAPSVAAAELSGKVSSSEEGMMEGVLVTARLDGSTISHTVATQAGGVFSFPGNVLSAGKHVLSIRATGYEIDGATPSVAIDDKAATVDLKLRKASDIVPQVTNAEWIASMPGGVNDKKQLLGCTNCHTLQRIADSKYTSAEFLEVMGRMAQYSNNSFPLHPQIRVAETNAGARFGSETKKFADFLSTLNMSSGDKRSYDFKLLPRIKGQGTKFLITEFDLPKETMEAHDVVVDRDGMVFFSDFGANQIGQLDPKTGKITEHPYPVLREGYPMGGLDLEQDESGNFWLAMMYQGGILRFDRKTGEIRTYPVPKELMNEATQQALIAPHHQEVDGKVWVTNVGLNKIHRVDVKTGAYETIDPFKDMPKTERHSAYGMNADKQNNLWFNDFSAEGIVRIDAKTLEVTMFKTGTARSRPRRGHMDSEGRLAFGEFYGDRAGVLDTRTGKMTEYTVPTQHTAPYDAALDKYGFLWTAGMEADRIVRIDTATGEAIEYPLPRQTNIRRIFVDDSTKPSTVWVGNNEGASIVRLQPSE
jgi:virginiamycin B lyase